MRRLVDERPKPLTHVRNVETVGRGVQENRRLR